MTKANPDVNIVDLSPQLKDKIYELERELGRKVICTSGYRSVKHPAEASKSKAGEHTYGNAVDLVSIGGYDTYMLVAAAIEVGFTRIGINRDKSFVHLGIGYPGGAEVTIWTY